VLGILYLLITTIFGWVIKDLSGIKAPKASPGGEKSKYGIPGWTFYLPFSFIVGTTTFTTFHYFISVLSASVFNSDVNPLFYSNIFGFLIGIVVILFFVAKKKRQLINITGLLKLKRLFKSYYFYSIIALTLFASYIIFYTFFVKDNIVHSGFTVFSDFAPHTAVINSFAKGHNFPAQYPHFAGDGINYHFFFFYLCGNLHYLGMRLDFAMNVPSIAGIVSFGALLGHFSVVLTRRKNTFLIAPAMLFFRSSNAVFSYFGDLYNERGFDIGTILNDIIKTDIFIGKTRHDDWGLWALNVYANQRHFLWGFSIILIIIMLFLPSLNTSFKDIKGFQYFTLKDFWVVDNKGNLVISAILIAILPYWHGSMLLTGLCVLFVMAFFAKERISYLAVGITGVVASLFWSNIFSNGVSSVANPSFYWVFISDDKSILGVLIYLFNVLGVSFILMFLIIIFRKGMTGKVMMLAFLGPMVFALTVSLTPDVTVNHKFIIASAALFNIFIAEFICIIYEYTGGAILILKNENLKITDKIKNTFKLVAMIIMTIILSFSVFSTGIVELIGYINKNDNQFRVDLNSPVITWVEANTDPEDIFLTAPYHMNPLFFTGRKIFYGWPYYTWTAGHDTFSRNIEMINLFSGYNGNISAFLETAGKYNLKYAIIDAELLNNTEYSVDVQFFDTNFERVLYLPKNNNTAIYKLYD